MTEIRENQGMTYGIYSSVDSFAKDGCFYISTETATDNTAKVIEAIRAEVDKLRNELIPEEELQMARNYLMGHLMTQLDGPFSSLDFIKSMKIEHLEDEQFAHTDPDHSAHDPGKPEGSGQQVPGPGSMGYDCGQMMASWQDGRIC